MDIKVEFLHAEEKVGDTLLFCDSKSNNLRVGYAQERTLFEGKELTNVGFSHPESGIMSRKAIALRDVPQEASTLTIRVSGPAWTSYTIQKPVLTVLSNDFKMAEVGDDKWSVGRLELKPKNDHSHEHDFHILLSCVPTTICDKSISDMKFSCECL